MQEHRTHGVSFRYCHERHAKNATASDATERFALHIIVFGELSWYQNRLDINSITSNQYLFLYINIYINYIFTNNNKIIIGVITKFKDKTLQEFTFTWQIPLKFFVKNI